MQIIARAQRSALMIVVGTLALIFAIPAFIMLFIKLLIVIGNLFY
jgi:hypothetical protein